jgi:glycosyltransferase involved in cell wall biosynthesis
VHLNDMAMQDSPGGGRKYVHEVAREMALMGHRVTVLVPAAKEGLPIQEQIAGYTLLRYPDGNPLQKQKTLQRAFLELHARNPVSGVVVHFAYTALGYHCLPVSQQIPTLRVFHGPWDKEVEAEGSVSGWKGAVAQHLRKQIERYSLCRSRHIVTLSEFMGKDVRERFGQPGAKISRIPGGVDTRLFSPGSKQEARRKLHLSEDAFILFCLRRLVHRMGLDRFLEAVALVKPDIPNLQVKIAGKGPQREVLAHQIQTLGLQNCVELTGFVPEEQLPNYYRAADLFVLPTIALEGFGLVILESLACNTPVLGTPVGAIPEVLRHFDPNLVLRDTSADAIAEGILRFYRQHKASRPDYRAQVECEFTWQRVTQRLLETLAPLASTQK